MCWRLWLKLQINCDVQLPIYSRCETIRPRLLDMVWESKDENTSLLTLDSYVGTDGGAPNSRGEDLTPVNVYMNSMVHGEKEKLLSERIYVGYVMGAWVLYNIWFFKLMTGAMWMWSVRETLGKARAGIG